MLALARPSPLPRCVFLNVSRLPRTVTFFKPKLRDGDEPNETKNAEKTPPLSDDFHLLSPADNTPEDVPPAPPLDTVQLFNDPEDFKNWLWAIHAECVNRLRFGSQPVLTYVQSR